MIKFITDRDGSSTTFGEIVENQFFISRGGHLFQKAGCYRAHMIATNTGGPHADSRDFDSGAMVTPLPHVRTIEFGEDE